MTTALVAERALTHVEDATAIAHPTSSQESKDRHIAVLFLSKTDCKRCGPAKAHVLNVLQRHCEAADKDARCTLYYVDVQAVMEHDADEDFVEAFELTSFPTILVHRNGTLVWRGDGVCFDKPDPYRFDMRLTAALDWAFGGLSNSVTSENEF